MKRLPFSSSTYSYGIAPWVLVLLLALNLACTKQKPSTSDVSMVSDVEAVIDEGDVILENEHVRLLRHDLLANAELPPHKGDPQLLYALKDCDLSLTLEGVPLDITLRKGAFKWIEGGTHALKNEGDGPAQFLAIARKHPALPGLVDSLPSQGIIAKAQGFAHSLAENEYMHVYDVELPPNKTIDDYYGLNAVFYALNQCRVKVERYPSGVQDLAMEPGEARWFERSRFTLENTGEVPAHFLVVEFLR